MSTHRCLGCMEKLDPGAELCPKCGYIQNSPPKEAYHLQPGLELGNRYLIGRTIGYGGFGVTYIGWDKTLEQKVAIKEYLPSELATRIPGQQTVSVFSGDRGDQFQEGLVKFNDEAQRLAACRDIPGVVRVYGSIQYNQTAYIIMEYLEGKTLKEYLNEQGGKLPYQEAVELLLPVLGALEDVHQMGILHRDISPENIFLIGGGMVKLLDFGAARYASTSHSKSLSVILKPGYAPEEQYRSHGNQGPWSDVYAVAATLYRMITGVVPEDAMERMVSDTVKPPSRLGVKLPKNAETAIMNALNIKIENRIQSAGELEGQLLGTIQAKRIQEHLPKAQTRKMPARLKGLLATAAVSLAVAAGLAVSLLIGTRIQDLYASRVINVPNVINDTLDSAQVRVENADLVFQVADKQTSLQVEANKIMTQTPTAGLAVNQRAVVEVVVSSGPVMSMVPDLRYRVLGAARLDADAAGFLLQSRTEASDLAPEGTVLSQSVEGGSKFKKGGSIRIVVSSGPEQTPEARTVTVPLTVGEDVERAAELMSAAGLMILRSEEQEYSMTIPMGQVISQSLPAGSTAPSGSVVTLTLSMGVEQTVIPDVEFKAQAEAEATLSQSKLRVTVVTEEHDTVKEGNVIRQDPAAGEIVDVQTPVSLVVSLGKRADLPDVAGSKRNQALQLLEKAGFTPTVQEVWSDTVPKETVISQSQEAGQRINVLTPIVLEVSKGIEQVTVPDVTGRSTADAIAVLKNAKLNAVLSESLKEMVQPGAVYAQSISAGKTVDKNTTLTLSYSPGVTVPSVRGLSLESASAALKQKGLSYTTEEEYNYDGVRAGNIIWQTPSSGRVALGERILLGVSKGEAAWSAWSEIEPDYSVNMVESRDLYRNRTIPIESPDWGAWQSSLDTSDRVVASETQSRVKFKEFSAFATAPAGWTPVGDPYVIYGDWSGWTEGKAPNASSSLEVETKVEKHQEEVITGYDLTTNVYRDYPSGWHWTASPNAGYRSAAQQAGGWYQENFTRSNISPDRLQPYEDGYKISKDNSTPSSMGSCRWYITNTHYDFKSTTINLYRTRSVQKQQDFWRWSDWSEWMDGYATEDSDTQVELRYRHRYLVGDYGPWSSWDTRYPADNGNIEVEGPRVEYRYRPLK